VGEGFESINKFKENNYWRKEGDGDTCAMENI
jgi:hypothetical protein